MRNMGPLDQILKMIPGVSNLPGMNDFEVDEKELDYMKAIVQSMTNDEREDPELLNQSRRKRISAGSARPLQEVNKLIKQFKQTREMMAGLSGGKMPAGLDQMLGNGMGGKMGMKALQGAAKNRNRKKRKKIRRRR